MIRRGHLNVGFAEGFDEANQDEDGVVKSQVEKLAAKRGLSSGAFFAS
jgi:hypothetical protein